MAKLTLEAARRNVKLSQKDASAILNISNKTLSSWENGKSFPKADKIDALCNLYQIAYDDIIFFPDNPL